MSPDMTLAEFELCMKTRGATSVSVGHDGNSWWAAKGQGPFSFRSDDRDSYVAMGGSAVEALIRLITIMPKLCCKCRVELPDPQLNDAEYERCEACGDPT